MGNQTKAEHFQWRSWSKKALYGSGNATAAAVMTAQPRCSMLCRHSATHLRHAVGKLLVVHRHALGLVQRHQRTRQELLQKQRCNTAEKHNSSQQTSLAGTCTAQ
jgi:hypothetical protein